MDELLAGIQPYDLRVTIRVVNKKHFEIFAKFDDLNYPYGTY